MAGDEQTRFCSECRLQVHNFASMGEPEILKVLQSSNGRICARIAQPPCGDLSLQSSDRPRWVRRIVQVATAALAMLLFVPLASARQTDDPPPQPVVQLTSSADRLDVRVLNRTAEPIRDAIVELQNTSGETLATATTDRHGRVRLLKPATGAYVLVVRAPLLMTYSRILDVQTTEVAVKGEAMVIVGELSWVDVGIPIDFPFASGPRDVPRPQGNLSK